MRMNPLVMPIHMWKASIDFWQEVTAAQLQLSRCALSIMGLWPSEQLKALGKAKTKKTGGVAAKPAAESMPAARLVEPQVNTGRPVPAPEAAKLEPAKVEAAKVDQSKPEAVQGEPGKIEPAKVEQIEAQASKGEAKAEEKAKAPVSVKAEQVEAESVKAATPQPVATAAAPAAPKVAVKPAVATKPARKKPVTAAKPKGTPRRKAAPEQSKAAEPMQQSTTRH